MAVAIFEAAIARDTERFISCLFYLPYGKSYGILHKSKQLSYYHCHLRRGHPTYVACWEIVNEVEKKIEVFYVGSHEDAPY